MAVNSQYSAVNELRAITKPAEFKANEAFRRISGGGIDDGNAPYWVKDKRFLNPEIKPEPIKTWGMVNNTPTIEKTGITMITATIGQGKSYSVLGMMLAVATCRKVGNFTPTNETPAMVIIFDTEMPDSDLYSRVQAIRNSNGGVMPDNIRYVPMLGMPKSERLKTIKEMLDTYNPDIVVVDTITRLVKDFNDSKEGQEFEDLLMPIVKHKCLIGVMHLTIGTDKAKGHLGSIMEEMGQQVWIAKAEKAVFSLTAKKIRTIRKDLAEGFTFTLDDNGAFVNADEEIAEMNEERKAELAELFTKVFEGKVWLEPKEIRSAYNRFLFSFGESAKSESHIDEKRNEAVKNGILKKKPNPNNKSGYLYALSSKSDFDEVEIDDDSFSFDDL